MARARSALPFIGSPGKHLPTIAATLNDARYDGAPAEAARRATPLLRSPQARDAGGPPNSRTKCQSARRSRTVCAVERFTFCRCRCRFRVSQTISRRLRCLPDCQANSHMRARSRVALEIRQTRRTLVGHRHRTANVAKEPAQPHRNYEE
jgi:hypothetical protein